MAKATYEQAYADHSYLWKTYGPASDMTGAYVDQEDLERLLRSPTKATARDCLVDQIEYWFFTGVDRLNPDAPDPENDERFKEIADRYGHEVGPIWECGA